MEPDAFEREVTAHRAYLLRVAQLITYTGPEDADDIVQDALARVRADVIDVTKGTCRSYLTQAVRWEAYRHQRTPIREDHDPTHLDLCTAETTAAPDDQWVDVERAITRLRPRLHAVVVDYLEGYTMKEIGQRQGYSAQRAHQHWKQAVRQLRGVLWQSRA